MVLMKLYSGVELLNIKIRCYRDHGIRMRHWRSNESPSMNIAISSALFTMNEGASDINVL